MMDNRKVMDSIQSFMQASRKLQQTSRNLDSGTYIVLDDDDNIAKMVSLLIKKRGKKARIAGSVMAAKLAIEEEGAENVACVVVDYQLPNGTGVDFITWLGNNHPQVPYFFYTANPDKVNQNLPPHIHEVCVVKKTDSMQVLMSALGV